MSTGEYSTANIGVPYDQALAGEGEYWDNFIADRLINHDEIPGSVDFRIFFTQFSRKHDWGPPCLGPITINFREREIRYVLTTAAPRPRMRVLDLGCGAGWLSLELARQGAHVTAVDISHTNLALGRYMVETNTRNFPFLYQKFAGLPCKLEQFGSVEYLYSDLNTINLPRAEFDAVVVWDSLHHVRDLERLLEQVRGALKPGGVFVGVDHAFATPNTIAFNGVLVPWIKQINAWLANTEPGWLYETVNALARKRDWDMLGVDNDIAPIPGFEAFEAQVRDEMLEIISKGLREEVIAKLHNRIARLQDSTQEEISPFEDVSAERLMQTLRQQFTVERFKTICPLIMPEQHFSPPRSESERIFQHYLSATLVEICERAIEGEQADGQWFLFHLTPERPREVVSLYTKANDHNAILAEQLGRIAELETELHDKNKTLEEMQVYINHVASELLRKNAAMDDLNKYTRQLEVKLLAARQPHLPWKRRRSTRR